MKRNGPGLLKRKYTRTRESEYKIVITLWTLVKDKKQRREKEEKKKI